VSRSVAVLLLVVATLAFAEDDAGSLAGQIRIAVHCAAP
jgi:hypothetical protein